MAILQPCENFFEKISHPENGHFPGLGFFGVENGHFPGGIFFQEIFTGLENGQNHPQNLKFHTFDLELMKNLRAEKNPHPKMAIFQAWDLIFSCVSLLALFQRAIKNSRVHKL